MAATLWRVARPRSRAVPGFTTEICATCADDPTLSTSHHAGQASLREHIAFAPWASHRHLQRRRMNYKRTETAMSHNRKIRIAIPLLIGIGLSMTACAVEPGGTDYASVGYATPYDGTLGFDY